LNKTVKNARLDLNKPINKEGAMFFKIIRYIAVLSDFMLAGLIIFIFAVGGINLFTFMLTLWVVNEWSREGIMLGFSKSEDGNG